MSCIKPNAAGWALIAATLAVLVVGCDMATSPAPGDLDAADNDSSSTSSKVYYVSAQGDDDADGSSTAKAFATIGRAVRVVQAGDTIAILPGIYQEALLLEDFGDSGAGITIRGEDGTPVLDGGRTLGVGFWCERCTNVTFDNMEIRDFTDVGLMVTASSSVTIRNLQVHGNGFAAQLEWVEGYGIHAEESRQITIEDNEVYENGPNPQVPQRWLGTGIDTFALTDSVIRNNRSYDNVGGGMLVEDSVNILVEGNEITGNNLDATIEDWWDGGIWIDGGRDVTLRNNTIRDNLGPGVEISDEDNQLPTGYLLEGNTITGNMYGLYIWNFGTTTLPSEDILRLVDNTVSENSVQDQWIVDWECPPDDPCE